MSGRLERVDSWMRSHTWPTDIVLAILLAIPILPMSLVVVGQSNMPRLNGLVLALSSVLIHVAIAARRGLPFLSFATISLVMAIQTVTPTGLQGENEFVIMPSAVLYPISLYSYSTYGRWPARVLSLAVGATGALLITVHAAIRIPDTNAGLTPGGLFGWMFLFGFLVAVIFAVWSYSLLRQVRIAYFDALEERARRAEAEREERARRAALAERTRISREMHDVVAHSLSVIVTQARGGQYAAAPAEVLATIENTGRQALADMRGLLGVLRTEDSGAGGDGAGDGGRLPQPTLAELPDLLQRVREAGLPVSEETAGEPRELGGAAELAVFRLVQESLTNTMKHAGHGASARVRLGWGDAGLKVTVSDDGAGQSVSDDPGHGLIGMRERISVVGGSVSAGPAPTGGFAVEARIPYRTEGARS